MNIHWASNEPGILQNFRSRAVDVGEAPFQGVWATIDLQPDLFSPQRFVIGIIVAPVGGAIVFRMIEDTGRLQCVYGKRMAGYLDDLIKSAELSLLRLARDKVALEAMTFDSDNIQISECWPTSGDSQENVLARLFREVVALEPGDDDDRPFASLDTEQVRRLVGAELKRIAGLAYEHIVVDARHTRVVDDSGVPHQLDFNLRTKAGAGSVISAVYKTPNYVELNLLRADQDLRTYGAIRKLDDLALFIMAPKAEQFEGHDFDRVSSVIDETAWRMGRGGLRVTIFDEPRPIAESVLEWAGVEPV